MFKRVNRIKGRELFGVKKGILPPSPPPQEPEMLKRKAWKYVDTMIGLNAWLEYFEKLPESDKADILADMYGHIDAYKQTELKLVPRQAEKERVVKKTRARRRRVPT